ncbi:cation diffusion facilitator family transporter [Litoribrevibacter albus]|uniref:Cation-efflux pump FieF n=1 Tax=Litoribrevibacter albus TaxID=1473156 RepID=A0AA37W5E9_9GAMM|nr:cation diffusion facilitator family transporter [Litoribrevibacter albus]GLQ30505.1 cation-efflux pump FieF [Litoribrevibacter albus]
MHDYARLTVLAGWVATGTALFLIATKVVAVMMTGSSSVLASLTDSLLDLAASAANLYALKLAVQPADKEHRFGHGKAEGLAGLAQGTFISGSCVLLVLHAMDRILEPQPVRQPEIGIVVMIISMIATLALVSFQHYVAKVTGSLAIKGDSLHYKGDLLMNLAILVALVLASYGFNEVDGWFALCIAVYILYSAWCIGKEAVNALMDTALDDDSHYLIKDTVMNHPRVHGMHELRTRQSGPTKFIQFHLELDDFIPLSEAHQVSDEVEASLRDAFPDADILIHQDPQSVVRGK